MAEEWSHVSDVPLGENDIAAVYKAVVSISDKLSILATQLGLPPSTVDRVNRDYTTAEGLRQVLLEWLKRNYKYQEHGLPSWRMLCAAVADEAGGCNKRLASEIADQHPCVPEVPTETVMQQQQEQQQQQQQEDAVQPQRADDEAIKVGRHVEEHFEEMRLKFATMFSEVMEKLTKAVELDEIKSYLELWNPDLSAELAAVHKVNVLIGVIRRNCSFTNYSILKELARRFKNHDALSKIKTYSLKRKKYYKRVLAEDFARAALLQADSMPNGHITVTFVVCWAKGEATLQDFESLMISAFHSIKKNITLRAVKQSLLTFICSIPPSVEDELRQLVEESQQLMEELGLVEVMVEKEVIWEVEHDTSMSTLEDRMEPCLKQLRELASIGVFAGEAKARSLVKLQISSLRKENSRLWEDNSRLRVENHQLTQKFSMMESKAIKPEAPEEHARVELYKQPEAAADEQIMSPDQLKEFIFEKTTTISVTNALVTHSGFLSSKDSARLLELVHSYFDTEVIEANDTFSFIELTATKDKRTTKWQWYPFKHYGYLSCFVSALEKQQDPGKILFAHQHHKLYMFDNGVLDNCFHSLYQLLSSHYKSKPQTLVDELTGGAGLLLINVWDIGFNRAVFHFLSVIADYLHHNLALSHTNKDEQFHEHFTILDVSEDLKPLLQLHKFSHLERSVDRKRKKVVAISEKPRAKASLHGSPWIIDPDDPDDLKALKENDELVAMEKKNPESELPLSWFFLRSAFFKTGQLYIKTKKLKECAKKCKITDDSFNKFLREFTGFGSIIHVPDIPVLCDYVILNPVDFFHKLSELYYPRFKGDLRYGIASLSTLQRIFRGDLQFFCDVLTDCSFAVEIDNDRIEYTETQRCLPIDEKCLYIPTIRTGELENSIPREKPLLLVYNTALQPTHIITMNAMKVLVDNVPNLNLLTCECYSVTRFHYYPHGSDRNPVLLEIISFGDKDEIRITNDEESATEIKQQVIQAYHLSISNYKQRHPQLLKCDRTLEFAFTCTKNPSQHHYISVPDQPCPACKGNREFHKLWTHWKQVLDKAMH